MAYKDRKRKVEALDMELIQRRVVAQACVDERSAYLRRQPRWVLAAAGAMGGMAAGMLASRAGSARRALPRLASLFMGLARLWPRISRWLASPLGPSRVSGAAYERY